MSQAAFRAEEGNTLVVADYGQLELRLLAHITDCKSMIEAFKVCATTDGYSAGFFSFVHMSACTSTLPARSLSLKLSLQES